MKWLPSLTATLSFLISFTALHAEPRTYQIIIDAVGYPIHSVTVHANHNGAFKQLFSASKPPLPQSTGFPLLMPPEQQRRQNTGIMGNVTLADVTGDPLLYLTVQTVNGQICYYQWVGFIPSETETDPILAMNFFVMPQGQRSLNCENAPSGFIAISNL